MIYDTKIYLYKESTEKEITNAELYKIILYSLKYQKIYTIREKNELHQIYVLCNRCREHDLAYSKI